MASMFRRIVEGMRRIIYDGNVLAAWSDTIEKGVTL